MKRIDSYAVRCLLAAVSGAVYSLAFPPLGWGWLVFPSLAGLLVSIRGQQGTRGRALGFLFGMAAFGIGLSWLMAVFGPAAIVLWMVLAAFPALFVHLQGMAAHAGMSGWKFVIFTAVNWSGWEFIRAELFPLRFPWMTGGLAMGPNTLLPWIGVYGVGFFVMLAVVLAVSGKWKAALVPVLVLGGGVAHFRKVPFEAPREVDAVRIAALQYEAVPLRTLLSVTRELPVDVEYAVWPEYAVSDDLMADAKAAGKVESLVAERNLTLTLGTKSGSGADWRNIALTLEPGKVVGKHTKNHTVHFFNDGKTGTSAVPVETKFGKVGTPICFDCDYEGVIRRMTAAGAEMIVSPVMDAAHWSARQHDQHAELFRIRACENGRWLFSSASSGISQAIDPRGKVRARKDAMEEGVMVATIGREARLTFYTRAGWIFPWIVTGVAAAGWTGLASGAMAERFRKRDGKKRE